MFAKIPVISVIFPSRGRAPQLVNVINEWRSKAIGKIPTEYVVVLDQDDSAFSDYIFSLSSLGIDQIILCPPPTTVNTSMNKGAHASYGKVIICSSDDFGACEEWDEKVWAYYKDAPPKTILMTDDGIQPVGHLCTLPTCDREFFNDWGYIYWEGYPHLYSDTDFTERAKRFGNVIVDGSLLFEHRHYSAGKAAFDNTYDRCLYRNLSLDSKELFEKRKAENFGRP